MAARINHFWRQLMTSIICIIATVLAILTIPAVLLWRLTLTKQQHAKRLRGNGWSYKRTAEWLGVSPTTARRYAMS